MKVSEHKAKVNNFFHSWLPAEVRPRLTRKNPHLRDMATRRSAAPDLPEVPLGKVCGGIAPAGIDREYRHRVERNLPALGSSCPRKLLSSWSRRDHFALLTATCRRTDSSSGVNDSACKAGLPETDPLQKNPNCTTTGSRLN